MSYTINNQYVVNECCYDTKPNVKYIVIHYTGNSADNALNNARYFYNNQSSVQGSAHFFVDSGNVVFRSVLETKSAWHVGDGNSRYGISNFNSLGIEMCTHSNYNVSSATENVAAQLAADLLKKYGLGINSLKRHYDASRKDCPRGWNNASAYASQMGGEARWNAFRNKVSAYMGGSGGNVTSDIVYRVYNTGNKQVAAYKNKNSALNQAKSIGGYVKDSNGNMVADYRATSQEIYRVKDAKGKQLAAFRVLENAKAYCNQNPGSSVYNSLGVKVHSSGSGELYRVKDANGKQLGAFSVLNNAKALCDKNPGSKVYNSAGTVVYSSANQSKVGMYLNITPCRTSWNVYPIDKTPVLGNQCGSLNPKLYNGLSYQILADRGDDVYEISTQSYGRVIIWAPNDGESTIDSYAKY